MKTHPLPFISRIGAFGRLLVAAFGVWLVGAVYAPPVMAATTQVSVSQSPLSLQPTIPPNVVLMLDDSGSMNWDVMPDYSYLGATPGSPTASELTSSDVNGLYYNPNVTYSPPYKANGQLYPAATFTAAWVDGFHTGNGMVNLTNYDGSSDSSSNSTCYAANAFCPPSNIGYTASFNVTTTGTPYAPTICPTGYSIQSNGQCVEQPATPTCGYNYTFQTTGKNAGLCVKNTNSNKTQSPTCQYGYTYSSTTMQCMPTPVLSQAALCNSSTDTYNANTNLCTPVQSQATYSFFTYTVKNSDGSFTSHYVGLAGTCALAVPGGMVASNCDDSAATQQNVANWYSYYHTRILMAKSGLMVAFNQIDPSFRFGFGSIDGGNYSASMGVNGTDPFTTSLGGGYNYSTGIAQVAPFDTNCVSSPSTCTPGQSGTQRADFWSWVAGETAGGGTPLRQALDYVGQYYQTSQPWKTMSTDPGYGTTNQPSNIACRQSYAILTTDGFWNDSFSSSNSSPPENGASNAPWPAVNGPNGLVWPTSTSGSSPGVPYSGGGVSSQASLADVALYYWENDLMSSGMGASNIPNEVPTNAEDPAFWQHMTTFTMGLGFKPSGITGKASNGDTPPTISDIFSAANGKLTLSNFSWPTPASNSINNLADLAHAGVNGHGGFYSATSPSTFINGLTDALNRASERVGTGASLAANSTQLTNGTVAYQATYYTAVWAGDLNALAINSSTGAIATTPTWSASTKLPAAANRTIVTYNPSGASGSQFVAFQNNSSTGAPPSLSTTELNALGSTATAQAAVVNYLRGDSSQEQSNGGNYRTRKTPLGDIVDSQPVYSGAPNTNEFGGQTFTGITNTATSGDNSFQGFAGGTTDTSGNFTASAASQREALVFVAGNDGMLHAFDASSGAETYAYLPGAVIVGDSNNYGANATIDGTALATLANTSYGTTTGSTPHQFYNDGELTIADVFDGSKWRTVLVGTTGRGPAEAVYALDVTNPSSITPLWERSANDGKTNSNYIGQMVGKPVIAKVQDGTTSDWQVLIGNGYNSASGQAALLEFDVITGTLSVHTTTNRSGYTTAGNGLAAPVAWMDSPAAGVSDVAYAGDLQGQVWRFPLSTSKTTGQGTTYTTDPATLGGTASDGFVVFTTQLTSNGTTNVPQPIMGGMLAGSDPATSNVWLFFGTGQYLNSNDLANMQVQSWYGVVAQPSGAFATSALTYSNLVQRAITSETDGNTNAVPPTLGVRTITTNVDSNGGAIPSGDSGWYINLQAPTGASGALVNQGERMVTSNQFQGNLLLATTRIPIVTDICNPSGSGWVMAVNPFTGTNPTTGFYQANGSTTVTITVGGRLETVPVAGVGFSSLPNNPIFVGGDMLMSFDNGTTSNVQTTGSTGGVSRVSWQELVNP
ncbi:pilus assembly protein [Dyella agri]|uniref:Pilus assembly protein PilY n=1 Tax=Dyella agri TaxID=1926869 RepID=A0ABW8KJ99_9GAMM